MTASPAPSASSTASVPHRSLRPLWIGAGLCLAGFVSRDLYLGTTALDLPDTQFTGYTAEFVQSFFSRLAAGRAGLGGVRLFGWTGVTLDGMFPVVVGMLVFALTRRVFRFAPWPMLALFPVTFVLLDWAENLSLASIAWSFAPPTLNAEQTSLAETASSLTQLKWTVLGAALLALGLGALTRRPSAASTAMGPVSQQSAAPPS